MTADGTNAATIRSRYAIHDPVQEAKMPAERFDFHNAEGLQLAALLDRPAARRARSRCLRTASPVAKHNRAARRIARRPEAARYSRAAFRFHRARRQRRRVRRHHVLLQRRRSGRRRRPLASNPCRALDFDRPRPRRSRCARRRPSRPRSARGGDDQCPVRSRHVTGLLADGKAASGDEDTIGAFSHSLSNRSTCRSTIRRATDFRSSSCGDQIETAGSRLTTCKVAHSLVDKTATLESQFPCRPDI